MGQRPTSRPSVRHDRGSETPETASDRGILHTVGVRGPRQRRDPRPSTGPRSDEPGPTIALGPPQPMGHRLNDPRTERVEELADEVRKENPDPTTRREAFELDLMDEGLVDEGRDVTVVDNTESTIARAPSPSSSGQPEKSRARPAPAPRASRLASVRAAALPSRSMNRTRRSRACSASASSPVISVRLHAASRWER